MEPNVTERLDAALVTRGIVSGREKAKEMIRAGLVKVCGKTVRKPAQLVTSDMSVEWEREDGPRYVGRGGEKLEKAIAVSGFSPKGQLCLDVGASTGGFTDCMLQHGADRVIALDVGHGQLHERLRADRRVINLEGTDIRDREKIGVSLLPASVQFCTVDVSFISLKKILPDILYWLAPGGTVMLLIKPQFEAGRQAVGKKGVVRDAVVHRAVLADILPFLEACGLGLCQLTYSPITGGNGNIEYLAVARLGHETFCRPDLAALVKQSHEALYSKRS